MGCPVAERAQVVREVQAWLRARAQRHLRILEQLPPELWRELVAALGRCTECDALLHPKRAMRNQRTCSLRCARRQSSRKVRQEHQARDRELEALAESMYQ